MCTLVPWLGSPLIVWALFDLELRKKLWRSVRAPAYTANTNLEWLTVRDGFTELIGKGGGNNLSLV